MQYPCSCGRVGVGGRLEPAQRIARHCQRLMDTRPAGPPTAQSGPARPGCVSCTQPARSGPGGLGSAGPTACGQSG